MSLSQSHLSLVTPKSHQQMVTKTPVTFRPWQSVCGHTLERSDIHRAIRLDGTEVVLFSEVEYQLFLLLVEHHSQRRKEVSYGDIATRVFGYKFICELLPIIRKRVSAIRKKVVGFGIDIISVPQHGYELRSLNDLTLPYRRGIRGQMGLHSANAHDEEMSSGE